MAKQRHHSGWLTQENGNWYGHYNEYVTDPKTGEETRKQPVFVLGKLSEFTKWQARKNLSLEVERRLGEVQQNRPNPGTSFKWFVENRYIPMRRAMWGPVTRPKAEHEIRKYIISHFPSQTLGEITDFHLQMFLNRLAEKFSNSVVRHCHTHVKAIMKLAAKQRFLSDNPAEDLQLPNIKPVKKPRLSQEQIADLIIAIEHPRDHALMCTGLFCGIRPSETFGLTWGAYDGGRL